MKSVKNPFTVLDLFSGCGGLSLGFHQAGFDIVGAVEYSSYAVETYLHNFPSSKMIQGDIRSEEIRREIRELAKNKKINIIIGGFPCQGFSLAGNRDPLDPRGQLYKDYLSIVKEIKPLVFVMENVKGLLSMKVLSENNSKSKIEDLKIVLNSIQRYKDLKRFKAQRDLNSNEKIEYESLARSYKKLNLLIQQYLVPLFPMILNEIRKLGYKVEFRVLNSVDYGTPQSRERVFIIAFQENIDASITFPEPTHNNAVSVKKVLKDLEGKPEGFKPNHIYTRHKTSFIKRISEVKIGSNLYKNYNDAWWRLIPDQPSRTVKENHGAVFLHYNENRVITPREMARLQDFPDDFFFFGPKNKILVQIGNAVPSRLSKAIANEIKKSLDSTEVNSKLSEIIIKNNPKSNPISF